MKTTSGLDFKLHGALDDVGDVHAEGLGAAVDEGEVEIALPIATGGRECIFYAIVLEGPGDALPAPVREKKRRS